MSSPLAVSSLPAWLSFLAVGIIGALILWVGWWLVRKAEDNQLPASLGALLIGAAVLHLAVGVLWYTAIPVLGHHTPAEQAGYIMADAHQRDQKAWQLAQSSQSLLSAFRNNRAADQYGGMLFISSLVYRYLGGPAHQPLLMVVIVAAVSALAVLFTWAFSRRVWDDWVAWIAAWIMVFYPEFVLMGSSQMREAFLIPLTIAAFYGLARYFKVHTWISLAWIAVPIMLMLPFSPPSAALTLLLLAITGLVAGGWHIGWHLGKKWTWLLIGGLVLAVLAVAWIALQQFAPEGMTNPLQVLEYWLRKSAYWQAYLSESSSGWLQKVFDSIPEWMRLPVLLAYGIVQPFLPAALIATSESPLWTGIAIWRAVGWSLMMALLLYATLLAFRNKGEDQFTRMIILIVWVGILIASYRGGGDQWDNPRYRSLFVGLQAAVMAWGWVEQRRTHDPWFRRAWMALLAVLIWFIPWYLRRYTPLVWPVVDLFKTIGLGVATAVLVCLWDWARTTRIGPVRQTPP
ncbi:MAG: conserved rane protein of unknown function [Chloroflexi bacterium]|nr:conserved rane protein of unknown function [Chloroflexota bacterium]